MLWFKRGLWTVVILIAVGVLFVAIVVNPSGPSPLNDYRTDGRIAVDGLKAPVRIYRDEKGMPYICARNKADLIMAQGYATAMDRLFQMELTRLFASGRIGELAGMEARSVDLAMRTLGFRRNAKKHWAILDEDNRRFLQSYADGVNAFIRTRPQDVHLEFRLAGIEPELWHPLDTLAILYYMGWQSAANLRHEIAIQMLIEKLGLPKASELFPLNINPAEKAAGRETTPSMAPADGFGAEALAALASLFDGARFRMGSNNWAVTGSRTASGKPVLANDPHLDARVLPGPWYPSGLFAEDIRAVGVTIPGLPGMILGRTAKMAFGITNAYGDGQDLYVETIDPRDRNRYMEGDGSVPFQIVKETLRFKDKDAPGGFREEEIAIRLTRRGPVVTDILKGLETDKAMTVRWTAFEKMGRSIALERALSCDTVESFREALQDVNYVALNWVFADDNGDIGWHVSGQIPIRSGCDGIVPCAVVDGEDNWTAWVPFDRMPRETNPPRGWLGTANHKTVDREYPFYYSNYFSTSYRQRRMMELLGDSEKKAAEEHWQYQRDIHNLKARSLAPIMAEALSAHADTAAMGRILQAWDCEDSVGRAGPAIFHAVFNRFAYLVYADELGDMLSNTMLDNTYFWEERLAKMMTDNDSAWFDDVSTSGRTETRDDLLHRAALDVARRMEKEWGGDPGEWHWGKMHRYDFYSPVARSGFLNKWLGGGSFPAAGSRDTLCRSFFQYDDLSEVVGMASLRMVVDLGDEDKIMAVLPGGVAGRLFHPHATDQIPPYIHGDPVYWWFSDAQIKSHARHELFLAPAGTGSRTETPSEG